MLSEAGLPALEKDELDGLETDPNPTPAPPTGDPESVDVPVDIAVSLELLCLISILGS
jgi:hypothetical protein